MASPEFPRQFKIAEQVIARRVPVSSERAGMIRDLLQLPENVTGLTIVDLGAGGSSLTSFLLQQKADAWAVDCIYDMTPDQIRKRIVENNTLMASKIPPQWKAFKTQEVAKALEEFSGSFRNNRERYKTGWLSDVPFPNDFADFTLSLTAISTIGQENFRIYEKMIEEAIRITKKSGRVLVAPFFNSSADNRIVNMLSSNNSVEVRLKRSPDPRYSAYVRMEIVKK